MTNYAFPPTLQRPALLPKTVYVVASGDLRLSANTAGWATQQQLEADFARTVAGFGFTVQRAHETNPATGHGFIDSQRAGLDVFRGIPTDAPLVVVDAVWQYSHHVLAGLRSHRGPILAVANWAGDFPGLVGLLNLTGSLTKAGIGYSSLWSKDFSDAWAVDKVGEWLTTGSIVHDVSHVRDLGTLPDTEEVALGQGLARQLQDEKAIIGVFDEGCMGMYNAIIDDELLNALG
ncbi:MAG: fucose isomerase, partial [Cryobacterium sp.]